MTQSDLSRLWEEHTSHEFVSRDTESTLATMVDDAYVNHVPVLTGGFGKTALREFYSQRFIPNMPPDTTLTPVSRTVGQDQLVDEMIFSFTHTQASVLKQIGLLTDPALPVFGVETARKVVDPRFDRSPATP